MQKQDMKDNIIEKHWLNSDYMSKVSKLMLQAGYSLNGFQDTLLAPLLKKNGAWHIPTDGSKSQRSPSTTIHYSSQPKTLGNLFPVGRW